MMEYRKHDPKGSVKHWAEYFAGKRAEYIAAYRAAWMDYQRRDARDKALHFGRLYRKMRGAL